MPHSIIHLYIETKQAVNLSGFRASMNPKFDGGILDFMDGIPNFMGDINTF